jgi:HK97 gp10 family phage protein
MAFTMKVEGFKELEAELEKLSKAAGKGVLRRALKKAAQPMADLAQSLAPVGETRTLSSSVTVSTRLSKRQASMHRKMFSSDRASVEMFVGAGPYASAHTQEFGTVHHGPQPFMRPAWDQDKNAMLARLKAELWSEVQKTVARAEARAARLAAKG